MEIVAKAHKTSNFFNITKKYFIFFLNHKRMKIKLQTLALFEGKLKKIWKIAKAM